MSDTHEVTDVALSVSGSDGSVEVEESSVGWCGCHSCMKASQRCPRDCHNCMREQQRCPPNCEKCLKDEARQRERREEDEERERERGIKKPWLFETQHPMTEPPNINYRNIIIYDQDRIDRLLEDEDMHFTERCLRYQEKDAFVEDDVLEEYKEWSWFMLDAANKSGDNTRKEFFQGLWEVVREDRDMVWSEWAKLDDEQVERARQRAARRLGVPANHEEWTSEDRQRFYEDDEYVRGWPNGDRDRYRAAHKLGIPENHEEWTSEDRQLFHEDDEYVEGWPDDDRDRYRAAHKLGIPENHEEWTSEDRQRFYEDDEDVPGWPNNDSWQYRAAQRLGIPENHEEWTREDRQRFYEDDQYVLAWPDDDRDRYRAAQRLGVPENHEEWTREDRQRFYEDGENVHGWPTDERKRYRSAQALGIPENHEDWTTEDKRRYVDSDEARLWSRLWSSKYKLRKELKKIDEEALAHSSNDEHEARSEDEINLSTADNENFKKSPELQFDGDKEAPSPPSDPAESTSEPEVKDDDIQGDELEANSGNGQSRSSLIVDFQSGRAARFYRPLATILLVLLLNEVIKQQLHL